MYPTPRQTLATLLLLVATLLSAPAAAQSSPTHGDHDQPARPGLNDPATDTQNAPHARGAERLAFLLSGFEHVPDRRELDQVGSPAEVVGWLNAFLNDPEERAVIRLRALDLLSLYASEEARVPLSRLAAADHRADDHPLNASVRTRAQARHRALTALARNDHPQAFDIWRDALKSDDIQIRITAIGLLRRHAPERALPHLEQLATEDTRPAVQRALNRPIGGASNAPSRLIP
ncbi:HEAT repeat domain-containing protein [Lujinxingia vulgaris]|uniref:HEAT repeat domain-containing protein n=1 Tax=Lujinxingia vulgaris TaxID=2600176 RepID=A0A5C6XBX2_9DELT|nr:HEAT repeat domain-containing protein [Lujinxingia vulgaris]TXD35598.1 HEAT repeat domain-containing protein [Lujinxingia vulgaris]